MDTVTFTVYIIYSCLCGDTMAANNALSLLHRVLRLCQSLWQSPTSRHGQRLWQTAPQAQPWFDCPTSIYFQHTATELEVCVCGSPSPFEGIGTFLALPPKGPTSFLSDVIFEISAPLYPAYSAYSSYTMNKDSNSGDE
ncbi:hypothetical protein ILYODFUR_037325 [Ilyodon furcidens]|uniref:Uncharacterized protein n=1 Tax=Ilyodon furcidens TaxID=33524 RepID=A0ABV0VA70_9TELE